MGNIKNRGRIYNNFINIAKILIRLGMLNIRVDCVKKLKAMKKL